MRVRSGKAEVPHHGLCDTGRWLEPSRARHGIVSSRPATRSGGGGSYVVMVILEMDGDSDALLAADTEPEARRPTSAGQPESSHQ